MEVNRGERLTDRGSHDAERGRDLLMRGRADRALEFLGRAVADGPGHVGRRVMLSECLSLLGRYGDALREADEALALDPQAPMAHYTRARALGGLARLDEAERSLDEVRRLVPTWAGSYAFRAAVLRARGRTRVALESAREALRFDPASVEVHRMIGELLLDGGRDAEASEAVHRALTLAPDDGASHLLRGWLLLYERRPREAAEAFRQALRLDPAADWAREGLIEALKAQTPIYRRVLPAFNALRRMKPGNRAGLITLAALIPCVVGGLNESYPRAALALLTLWGLAMVMVTLGRIVGTLTLAWIAQEPSTWAVLSGPERSAARRVRVGAIVTMGGLAWAGLAAATGLPAAKAALLVAGSGVIASLPASALLNAPTANARRMIAFLWALMLILQGGATLALAMQGRTDGWSAVLVPLFVTSLLGFMTVWVGTVLSTPSARDR